MRNLWDIREPDVFKDWKNIVVTQMKGGKRIIDIMLKIGVTLIGIIQESDRRLLHKIGSDSKEHLMKKKYLRVEKIIYVDCVWII